MNKRRGTRGKGRKVQKKTTPELQPDYYIPPIYNGLPVKRVEEKKENA